VHQRRQLPERLWVTSAPRLEQAGQVRIWVHCGE
jgi:hypothetical protein